MPDGFVGFESEGDFDRMANVVKKVEGEGNLPLRDIPQKNAKVVVKVTTDSPDDDGFYYGEVHTRHIEDKFNSAFTAIESTADTGWYSLHNTDNFNKVKVQGINKASLGKDRLYTVIYGGTHKAYPVVFVNDGMDNTAVVVVVSAVSGFGGLYPGYRKIQLGRRPDWPNAEAIWVEPMNGNPLERRNYLAHRNIDGFSGKAVWAVEDCCHGPIGNCCPDDTSPTALCLTISAPDCPDLNGRSVLAIGGSWAWLARPLGTIPFYEMDIGPPTVFTCLTCNPTHTSTWCAPDNPPVCHGCRLEDNTLELNPSPPFYGPIWNWNWGFPRHKEADSASWAPCQWYPDPVTGQCPDGMGVGCLSGCCGVPSPGESLALMNGIYLSCEGEFWEFRSQGFTLNPTPDSVTCTTGAFHLVWSGTATCDNGSEVAVTLTWSEDLSGCVGSSGSGSGGGGSIPTPCNPTHDLPFTLDATFTVTSGTCADINGQTISLIYDGFQWKGSITIGGKSGPIYFICGGEGVGEWNGEGFASDSTWSMDFLGAPDPTTDSTNPLQVTFTGVHITGGTCNGVVFTMVVTEP